MKTAYTKTTWVVLTVLGFMIGVGGGIIANNERKAGYENGYEEGHGDGFAEALNTSRK